MGLSLEVGLLADLLENDEEGAEFFREELDALNKFLASKGFSLHKEPESCEKFSCDMYGYSGLYYLRRLAAHLELRKATPPPLLDDDSDDPVITEYYQLATDPKENGYTERSIAKPGRPNSFDHLMLHSDANGFYLPSDFDTVLCPPDEGIVTGDFVGSSQRLLAECKRIASAIGMPLDLDPESDEVWEAAESQGAGDSGWQRYGIESFSCIRLIRAAEHSLKTGAAIVFS